MVSILVSPLDLLPISANEILGVDGKAKAISMKKLHENAWQYLAIKNDACASIVN